MGVVLEAEHETLRQRVAIKLMRVDGTLDEERFRRLFPQRDNRPVRLSE